MSALSDLRENTDPAGMYTTEQRLVRLADRVNDAADDVTNLGRGKANDYTTVVHLVRWDDPTRTALCGRVGCFDSPLGRPGEHGEGDCPRCRHILAVHFGDEEESPGG